MSNLLVFKSLQKKQITKTSSNIFRRVVSSSAHLDSTLYRLLPSNILLSKNIFIRLSRWSMFPMFLYMSYPIWLLPILLLQWVESTRQLVSYNNSSRGLLLMASLEKNSLPLWTMRKSSINWGSVSSVELTFWSP